MPSYNYCCEKCKTESAKEIHGVVWIILNSGRLAWEETHSINAKPEIRCPICNEIAKITIEGVAAPTSYIRGNGYLDKAGCLRDMNLHKLENNEDPYAPYRQKGEVDDIKSRLKKAGKKSGKGRVQLGGGV